MVDVDERMSMAQVIAHPWLTDSADAAASKRAREREGRAEAAEAARKAAEEAKKAADEEARRVTAAAARAAIKEMHNAT